ncbi:MAG: hypothetical protein QOJ89_1251 [bacterium]|jgi:hypothetical protein
MSTQPGIGTIAFRATIELGGKTATGIEVPQDAVAAGDEVDVRPIAKAVESLREDHY